MFVSFGVKHLTPVGGQSRLAYPTKRPGWRKRCPHRKLGTQVRQTLLQMRDDGSKDQEIELVGHRLEGDRSVMFLNGRFGLEASEGVRMDSRIPGVS